MRTVLDDSGSWFLESVAYSEKLRIVVVEGIVAKVPEDFEVGGIKVTGTYPVDPATHSRRVAIEFDRTVSWQVVDESYTAWDETEKRDDICFLSILSESAYLRFAEADLSWLLEQPASVAHYRLWTLTEVVDVLALDAPRVEVLDSMA